MIRQMGQLGHAKVCDGDEVACRSEASCGAFGLLQQAVHGFDEGIGSVVQHAADHASEVGLQGLGQFLKGSSRERVAQLNQALRSA